TMLVGSWPDENARGLVELARDGGMNMLRVWGGGVIAPEAFYDACDELGVLVWQDFLFACFDYPDPRGDLAAEITLEAADQVRRLRHHASLALWCGENEIQAIRELTTGNTDPAGDWGWALFNELLPTAVAEHDPDTAYWPGSPWGSLDGSLLNGTAAGDRHAWEVWHGASVDIGAGGPPESATRGELVHFNRYESDRGRFISEFGIHASPELGTLERWTPPGTLAPGSDELHQRNKDNPKDKGYALMAYETGEPTTIEEYVDFTMACQAEGLKVGVEHYRRRQPHCGGTLVWQLNDCWPGLSWSVIDYDLVPKASYYFLQRAYQPLLTSFTVDDDGVSLWVTNSGLDDVALDLFVSIGPHLGEPLVEEKVSVLAAPYSSAAVWRWTGTPTAELVARVREASGRAPTNRRFFGRLKDLPVSEGRVRAEVVERNGPRAVIRLTASGYCYLARLEADHPGVRFSQNYVDLGPGESCEIEVTGLTDHSLLTAASYCSAPTPLTEL
ncbi:MAG: glycoside hydrolase family 2 protein, partial [Nocardioides sp.]